MIPQDPPKTTIRGAAWDREWTSHAVRDMLRRVARLGTPRSTPAPGGTV
ncbi:MAG TPA: hypothetical protein VIY28_12175 [Pseudonocardiaceae bacterium]